VRAGVVDVLRAAHLEAHQVANGATPEQVPRTLERRAEAPLVVERQLHAPPRAFLRHQPRGTPRIGHRLLTVDGAHARAGAVEGHRRVQVRPGADADHVQVGLSQHGAVVGEHALCRDARGLGEGLGVLPDDVGTGHQRAAVDERLIARGVPIGHRKARHVGLLLLPTCPDDAHPQPCHAPLSSLNLTLLSIVPAFDSMPRAFLDGDTTQRTGEPPHDTWATPSRTTRRP
jgi:hypothetical protein